MKGPAFLDTNMAIYWALASRSVPMSIIELIARHPKAYVSAISVAEVEIKKMLKKPNQSSGFSEALSESGIEIASFDQASAEQLPRFESLVGHDPFDRLILAQASTHRNGTFYTTDRKLAELGLDWVVHVTK